MWSWPDPPPLRVSPVCSSVLTVLGFLKASLTSKEQGKETLSSLVLSLSFVIRSPDPYSRQTPIFPSLPFTADVPVEAFPVALHIPHQIQLQMGFALLTPALHAQTVSLYFTWVTCPCLLLLYASS